MTEPSVDPSMGPIAADGGFGPMDFEEDDDDDNVVAKSPEQRSDADVEAQQRSEPPSPAASSHDAASTEQEPTGQDFDDFEEGELADDFGEFDDAVESMAPEPVTETQSAPLIEIPFDVLDYSELESFESLVQACSKHWSALFPILDDPPQSPNPLGDPSSAFLSERSRSLWSQLIAPPPLQPPNWVRSRVRRLFLVSLGVPVDLDEILPKSKQKKLVLPYASGRTSGTSHPRSSSRAKNGSAEQTNDPALQTPTTANGLKGPRRRKGPAPPPGFDMEAVRVLTATTDAQLEDMADSQLRAHVQRLEELLLQGEEVLKYWVQRKEASVSEKEAFDGVIENLVRHARRARK